MRTHTFRFILASLAGRAAVGFALLLCLVTGLPARAAEATTNSTTNTSGLSLSLNLSTDDENKNDVSKMTNFFGLPKEAIEKLSSEEIVELVKSSRNKPSDNNMWKGMEDVVIPIALFGMIVSLVFIGGIQRLKRQRMLHETIRMMIEKGQPIPPELLTPDQRMRRPRNDLRTGLSMVGIGVGLTITLISNHSREWPIALIPLLIGVAFLVTWKVEKNKPTGN